MPKSKCRSWECQNISAKGKAFCSKHIGLQIFYEKNKGKLSKCHNKEVITNLEAMGRILQKDGCSTVYYICQECKQPCDIKEADDVR